MTDYRLRRDGVLELWWNNEENATRLIEKVITVFGLEAPLRCRCCYDPKEVAIEYCNGKIAINGVEPTKSFHVVKLEEKEIIIDFHLIKDLIKAAEEYDVMLLISMKDTASTELIINDNGHNYLKFDKRQYDLYNIKKQLDEFKFGST